MKINADFNRRVVVRPDDYKWVNSPMPGVERMMLDRIGGEVARATTIVRFAPNSEFSPHAHDGGEEFFVLEGVFSDEQRDYPAGTYVRNPIGTGHTPRIGASGATILVKLHQFDPKDQDQKHINTHTAQWSSGAVKGQQVMLLHVYGTERVELVRWAANMTVAPGLDRGGEEIFILEGCLYDEQERYPKGTWLRSPDQHNVPLLTKAEGATLLVKTGHLGDTLHEGRFLLANA